MIATASAILKLNMPLELPWFLLLCFAIIVGINIDLNLERRNRLGKQGDKTL